MYTKKITRFIALLLSVTLLLSGCASSPSKASGDSESGKEKKITFRLGHEMPEDHPYHLGSLKFADLVNEKSNGRYEIIVYPNSQLGKQAELAEMVSANQLEFCLAWQGVLESYDPDLGVISLPFIFDNWKQVYSVVDGEIGDELFKGVEEKGIKVLTNFNNGLYNIVSTKLIDTPEDLKGVKLRVQSSAVFTATGELLGAVVTPLAFSEIYSALQLKAIDAEIQGPINVRKSKHEEVAKYTCENNINFLLEPLMMSNDTFNSLSPEDQKIFLEAAHEAAVWQREDAERADSEDKQYLIDSGMIYTVPDKQAWIDASAPVYDKYPQWAEMVNKIKSAK